VDEADQLCPYSKATRGNIDVEINLVWAEPARAPWRLNIESGSQSSFAFSWRRNRLDKRFDFIGGPGSSHMKLLF
jgi:hypothetical protein